MSDTDDYVELSEMLEMALGGDPSRAIQRQQELLQKQQEESLQAKQNEEDDMLEDGGDYVELVDDRIQNNGVVANGDHESSGNSEVIKRFLENIVVLCLSSFIYRYWVFCSFESQ